MRYLTGKGTTGPLTCLRLRVLAVGMVGALTLIVSHTAMAQCTSVLQDGGFELQRRGTLSTPWVAEGRSGMDLRLKLSYRGDNNAWVSNKDGWNAIRQSVRLSQGVTYTLYAFVRTSPNMRDGYFGFRDANQRPVSEIKFGPMAAYKELSVKFRPTRTGTYNVFAGFWAHNPDTWIRVDDMSLESPCNDVQAIPADQ
jgi:hypothetical protein